jgi:hypothetical protein
VDSHFKPTGEGKAMQFFTPIPKEVAEAPPPIPEAEITSFFVSQQRMQELKEEATRQLPPGTKFISTNDAMISRLVQVGIGWHRNHNHHHHHHTHS